MKNNINRNTAAAIFFTLLCGILFSCSNHKDNGQTNVSDTSHANAGPAIQNDVISLKNIVLNEQTVITDQKLLSSPILNAGQIKELNIIKLDSITSPAFKYHLYDTLFSDSHRMVLLIARGYVEENVLWLAVYTDRVLTDSKEVYYDNSEGFLNIKSEIQNNVLTIKTRNDFAENEKEKNITESFRFDSSNKIVKNK